MNTQDAFAVLMDNIQKDDSYAIAWQCNLAMPFYDAGGDIKTANKGADAIMKLFFNVDMKEVRKRLGDKSDLYT
jgi:hypothetical protein